MLSPRWYKVIRDLWGNKTRTLLVVMAIAVGIFAFGSVFITQRILVDDMASQYRAIRTSTITMYLPAFDDDLVRWANRQEEVAEAQGRAVHQVKLVRGDETLIMDLYAYDDYQDIGLNRINLQTGIWPQGKYDISFERASLSLAGADNGGTVLIQTYDGTRRELNTVGSVHDLNAFPATMFPQLSGYVSLKTLNLLGLSGSYNRLEILTESGYGDLVELEKVADELKERLQDHGVTVNSVSVRLADGHWAQEATEGFTIILIFIGIFSLVLSGFLVVNTMSALLTEQKRQIGIMKAIGGTGRQIIGIYLVLVTAYGLLALVLAVPISIGLAYVYIQAVVQFLNINIVNFHLPVPILILQVAAAILVPVVASLVPVIGGVRITAREAISDYGISSGSKFGLIDRMILKIGGLPRPILLSLRNTFRRKGRLLLTLGTLTMAGALFLTVVNVRTSLMTEMYNMMDTVFNYEVSLSLAGNYQSSGVERRIEGLPGVIRAEGQTGIQAQRIKEDGTKGASFPIIGLSHDTEFLRPTMLSGRWLEENDRNVIVLSSNLADDMPDVKAGDNLALNINGREYQWTVGGIMLLSFNRVGYASFDYVSGVRGTPGLSSSIQVSLENKDGPSQAEMAKNLEATLKESGIRVNQSMTKDVIVSANANQFDFLVAFLLAMAGMTALIGGLGLAGMMSLNVIERTREIGVMRSIGASTRMISGIVLTEGVLIGLISWALAIPISVPLNLMFNTMLGQAFLGKTLIFVYTPMGVVIWLAIVVTVSIIASLLPAHRATRMSVRETLAYE